MSNKPSDEPFDLTVDLPSSLEKGESPRETAALASGAEAGTVDLSSKLNSELSPASLPAAASKLGRYEIVRELGRGGMGAVYLAYDTQLERQVALKIPLGSALADDGRSRFFREARAAAKLRHPNICPVYDVAEEGGTTFFTMAYIEGESLAARMRRSPLSMGEGVSSVRTLALAMQDAHNQGVVHRDLKPANVLIDQQGRPIVTDFGLARAVVAAESSPLTVDGQLLGTPAYMPPEQMRGDTQAMGPWSDQYSLGMILYELLAQRLPFTGSLATLISACLNDPPPPLANFRMDVPPALEAICRRMLAKQPAARFGSMAEIAHALAPFAHASQAGSEQPIVIEAESYAEPYQPPHTSRSTTNSKKARGWTAAIGCLTAVGLVVAACSGVAYLAVKGANSIGAAIKQDFSYLPNWDDTARLWRPPPDEQMPPDFSKLNLPSAKFVSQDDNATIADLKVDLPGRHALFREFPNSDVDVYVYRLTPLEREAVFTRVMSVIDPPNRDKGADLNDDGDSLTYPRYPSHTRSGGAGQNYIDYRHRWTTLEPGDAAVFWYDEGWLFVVRTKTYADPRKILSDLLGELNGGVRATSDSPPAAHP